MVIPSDACVAMVTCTLNNWRRNTGAILPRIRTDCCAPVALGSPTRAGYQGRRTTWLASRRRTPISRAGVKAAANVSPGPSRDEEATFELTNQTRASTSASSSNGTCNTSCIRGGHAITPADPTGPSAIPNALVVGMPVDREVVTHLGLVAAPINLSMAGGFPPPGARRYGRKLKAGDGTVAPDCVSRLPGTLAMWASSRAWPSTLSALPMMRRMLICSCRR
jgi:hypothetical protein